MADHPPAPTVHVPGPPVDGLQLCQRCRCVLAEPGGRTWEVGCPLVEQVRGAAVVWTYRDLTQGPAEDCRPAAPTCPCRGTVTPHDCPRCGGHGAPDEPAAPVAAEPAPACDHTHTHLCSGCGVQVFGTAEPAPAPLTLDELSRRLDARAEAERAAGAAWFMNRPDRWYAAGKYRCTSGHVSTRFLKTETRGDLCLACHGNMRLTFPEDTEGSVLEPAPASGGDVETIRSFLDANDDATGEYAQPARAALSRIAADTIPRGAIEPLLRHAIVEAFRRAGLEGTPGLPAHVTAAIGETLANIDGGCVESWAAERDRRAAEVALLQAGRKTLATAFAKACSEGDELAAARRAYASEFPPGADGEPDVGSVHANIRALKAELARHRAERVAIVTALGGGVTDANLVERVMAMAQDREEYRAERDTARATLESNRAAHGAAVVERDEAVSNAGRLFDTVTVQAAELRRAGERLAAAERSVGIMAIDRDAARKQAEEALKLARQQGEDATHLEAQLQAALAAPLARVAGRVRRVLDGRVRIHLDEEPVAWDGAAEGAPLVVTITRGEA